jgi:hypothetical protein
LCHQNEYIQITRNLQNLTLPSEPGFAGLPQKHKNVPLQMPHQVCGYTYFKDFQDNSVHSDNDQPSAVRQRVSSVWASANFGSDNYSANSGRISQNIQHLNSPVGAGFACPLSEPGFTGFFQHRRATQ